MISYIALGSNLDQPIQHVLRAAAQLRQIDKTTVLDQSHLYLTSPQGPVVQDEFINAVVSVRTELNPEDLLNQCLSIERRHGRIRTERWGPRTLDLDILLYGNLTLTTDQLCIPHRHLLDRLFVLIPLQEISPKLRLPNNKSISEQIIVLQQNDPTGFVKRLEMSEIPETA